jgi:hypothetical protein
MEKEVNEKKLHHNVHGPLWETHLRKWVKSSVVKTPDFIQYRLFKPKFRADLHHATKCKFVKHRNLHKGSYHNDPVPVTAGSK